MDPAKLLLGAAAALLAAPATAVEGPERSKGVRRAPAGSTIARQVAQAKGAVRAGTTNENSQHINEHNARIEAERQARLARRGKRKGERK